MILSVSRRTDIPALYCDWFFDALKAGEVLVPNPFISGGKTAKIKLAPLLKTENLFGTKEVSGNIEGIVFWTKNPQPMLARLDELGAIPYYFQFTLNAYGKEYESNLPPLADRIAAFISLAKRCRVIWRYDPIFYSKSINQQWHVEQFEALAKKLEGSTKICMINTLIGRHGDAYCPSAAQTTQLAAKLAKIAAAYGIEVKACAEIIDLEKAGIKKGKCLDPEIFEKLLNAKVKKSKLKGSTRNGCGCMESIDIGAYSTCTNGCVYCYAAKDALKSIKDAEAGEIYERKTDLAFEY
ncbi:MAG: DUF1848 domain-containing protein [Firmicutes bacterium]|nr:DUF1848 domain-containing protein [Bacillota bacterium]